MEDIFHRESKTDGAGAKEGERVSLLARLFVKVAADTKDLDSGLNSTQNKVTRFGQNMSMVGGAMTKGITLPSIALGTALVSMTGRIAEGADEIDKMSIRTGISRENLQGLRFVTDQVGVSFQSLQSSTAIFTNNLRSAQAGTGEATEAFQALGISMEDASGNIRPINELYMESIRGLADMEDVTQRNINASRLFGRQFIELIPLLDAGEEGIDELMKMAEDLGLVMSDEGVASLVQYKDAMSGVTMSLGAAWREIAINFAPIMKDTLIPIIQNTVIPMMRELAGRIGKLLERFGELDPELQKNYLKWAGIIIVAGPVLSIFGNLIGVLAGAKGLVGLFGGAGLTKSLALATGGFSTMLGPIAMAIGLFWGLWEAINSVIKSYDSWLIRQKNVTPEQHYKYVDAAAQMHGPTYVAPVKAPSAPVTSVGAGSGGGSIPQMATGTDSVPRDMLAFLHKGEAVVPASENGKQNDIIININMANEGDPRRVAEEMIRHLRRAGVVTV